MYARFKLAALARPILNRISLRTSRGNKGSHDEQQPALKGLPRQDLQRHKIRSDPHETKSSRQHSQWTSSQDNTRASLAKGESLAERRKKGVNHVNRIENSLDAKQPPAPPCRQC